jgi:hypothetical protein
MVQCIVSRVKGLLSTVLEPEHYLALQAMKKLKADVVDKMEGLISDSYESVRCHWTSTLRSMSQTVDHL